MKNIISIFILFIFGCAVPEKEVEEEKIEEKPKLSEAKKHYSFGRDYLKNRMYEEAIKNFELAIKDSTDFVDAYISLAEAHRMKGELGEVERVYRELVNVAPVKGHYAIATLYIEKKNYDQAMEEYKKVIEIDSNYVDAWFGIAYIYEKKGEIKAAIENYEKAAKIDPNNEKVKYALGRMYIEDEQFDKGIDELKKLEEKYQENLDIKIALGNAYLKIKNYEKAKEKFKYVTERAPMDIINRINLAICYEGLKDYDNAIKTYKEAIIIDTTEISSYRYLIDFYIKIKKLDEADDLIKKAFKIKPNDQILQCLSGDIRFERGVLFFNQKKYDASINEYEKAINQYSEALKGEEEKWRIYAKEAIERTKIKLKEAKDEKWWH